LPKHTPVRDCSAWSFAISWPSALSEPSAGQSLPAFSCFTASNWNVGVLSAVIPALTSTVHVIWAHREVPGGKVTAVAVAIEQRRSRKPVPFKMSTNSLPLFRSPVNVAVSSMSVGLIASPHECHDVADTGVVAGTKRGERLAVHGRMTTKANAKRAPSARVEPEQCERAGVARPRAARAPSRMFAAMRCTAAIASNMAGTRYALEVKDELVSARCRHAAWDTNPVPATGVGASSCVQLTDMTFNYGNDSNTHNGCF